VRPRLCVGRRRRRAQQLDSGVGTGFWLYEAYVLTYSPGPAADFGSIDR
jgi:hypothetical protein